MRFGIGLALSSLSGALLVLSFPPSTYSALALVALFPALWARHFLSRSPLEGAVFAAVPALVVPAWFLPGMWPGVTWLSFLPVICAAVVFLAAWRLPRYPALSERRRAFYPLECAAMVVAFEWLRACTPLGIAGSLAVTQAASPTFLQLAAIAGPWGVTFFVVFVNAALVAACESHGARRFATILAVIAAVAGAGQWRLRAPVDGTDLRVVAVQSGRPMPEEPAETPSEDATDRSLDILLRSGDFASTSLVYLDRLVRTTDTALAGAGADLVVWPESSLQVDPTILPALRSQIASAARGWKAALVVPYFSPSVGAVPHGSMLGVFGRDGALLGTYQKQRVSYDAEYAPGPPAAPVFPIPERLSALICFDFGFAELPLAVARAGAAIVAAPSDDAYPGIAVWHYAHVVLHSAAHGVPYVKADTAYASLITDARGRIVDKALGKTPAAAIVRATVRVPSRPGTIYTTCGDWLAFLCTAAAALLVGLSLLRRRVR